VSPVKYELGFFIPEDTVLHGHRRENLKSYTEIKLALCPCPVFATATDTNGEVELIDASYHVLYNRC
jgi:hypothetical protein